MAHSDEPLIPKKELTRITNLSRATIDRMRKAGDFPLPLQISARRVAWTAKSIREWMDSRNPAI